MKPSNERPWIGTHKGKGGRDLDIRGEELSTVWLWKKGRAGVKLRGWPEIGPDGGVLLTPCVPLGITGIDDDDDITVHSVSASCFRLETL